jgi:hypothetical protein
MAGQIRHAVETAWTWRRRAESAYSPAMRVVVGIGFITTGVLHFTHTRVFKRIMPP